MGIDKARLAIGVETFLSNIVGRVSEAGQVFVIGRATQVAVLRESRSWHDCVFWGVDRNENQGPLEGLASGLECCQQAGINAGDWVMVVPVDMPLVTLGVADAMLENIEHENFDEVDLVLLATGSSEEFVGFPIFLRVELGKRIRALVDQGTQSLQDLQSHFRLQTVTTQVLESRGIAYKFLASANTLEEYKRLLGM